MKIKKFNESAIFIPSNDEEVTNMIYDLIQSWINMRHVAYADIDEMEIDPKSVKEASEQILKELKEIGVDFDLIYATKKYNL